MRALRRLTTACLMTSLMIGASSASLSAQERIENEQVVIYSQRWLVSKDPSQNGLMSYLTVQRGKAGEYFSVTCRREGSHVLRGLRLGFPEEQPSFVREGAKFARVEISVDGRVQPLDIKYTGTTADQAFGRDSIYGYEVIFPSVAARDGFIDGLRTGSHMKISGQSLPVELKGSSLALQGQEDYCK
ncbi:hypothetical protein ACX9MO_07020 [Pseudooceanicola sp. 502str34]|uniref:hypothetical protein n=1 Tax=Maritimibacter alkaliphilus TaxID=404236 RepID=UPI001C971608|nr:hypothetical protein [Maritimibacter alkaliphilus]MBY6090765.1 hypothetical protein [Maritimibacter alkaliphilus]